MKSAKKELDNINKNIERSEWNINNGKPTKLYPKSTRMSGRTIYMIKYALIFGILTSTFYAFQNINTNNFMDFLNSQTLVYVGLAYTMIYIIWQWINNRLSRFPVEVVKSLKKPQRLQQTSLIPRTDRKVLLFSIIGYTLSMAFSLMIMIFLAVALISGTGETRVIWNHFGEMMFETILFICAFVVIVVGYYFTYKNFKQIVRRVVR